MVLITGEARVSRGGRRPSSGADASVGNDSYRRWRGRSGWKKGSRAARDSGLGAGVAGLHLAATAKAVGQDAGMCELHYATGRATPGFKSSMPSKGFPRATCGVGGSRGSTCPVATR